jgi:hypothetical protein
MGKGEYSMKEKPWQITIQKAQNGFILKWDEQIDDNTYRPMSHVFEERDNIKTDHDCQAIQHMLYEVLDYFGVSGSKHDEERIRIEILKQKDE